MISRNTNTATNELDRLSKAAFMEKYILNRALGNTGGLEARAALTEAALAWEYLEQVKKTGKIDS